MDNVTETFLKNSNINYKNETTLIYKANLKYLLKDKFEKTFLDFNKDKYDNYKSYFIIGGIFNIYLYWIKNEYKESQKELLLKLVDLLGKVNNLFILNIVSKTAN